MTAIAYRDGVMCADSVGWDGSVHIPSIPKILRTENGWLVAACGDTADVHQVHDWARRGFEFPPPKLNTPGNFTAIRVARDGTVERCEGNLWWFPRPGPYLAIGACPTFMYGALAMGATAEETVRLAIAHTDGAAGEIQIEHIVPLSMVTGTAQPFPLTDTELAAAAGRRATGY